MDTKEIIIICLTIVLVALIIGGVIAVTNSNGSDDIKPAENPANTTSNNVTADKLSYDEVVEDDDGDIVSVEVKFNAQAGSGYYRQVTYKDGGFRQFDVDTGELIGSSYASDQKYLPSME